jgi:N-methylhydantoinase A
MLIGCDTGGTFTDLVLVHEGRVRTHKLPSTPDDFSRAVLEGVRALRGDGEERAHPALVHSTTVATNALLERRGARVALITTDGFQDVLAIGRQSRPELYNLKVERPEPLVPRERCLGVRERVSCDGEVLEELTDGEIQRVLDTIEAHDVEAIAISLLFSFLAPQHEERIATAAASRGHTVSRSSDILPEFREYERASTTAANAYVAPVMARYLGHLADASTNDGVTGVRVVQSNGGSAPAERAGRHAATTLLSGPAAGVMGALAVARQALSEKPKLITFDMGGTSTDVSLIDGDFALTAESEVGGVPVRVPMIDIHTVGAGGGSIAHIDAGGALRVGPRSSGAMPGPACYGHGGTEPTVTDANLLLGRLSPEHFLGGRMPLDPAAAERALAGLGDRLSLSAREAAEAALRIVNSNMERAIRVISVERGHDPREFTLFSFGGAGGLHACDLADALRCPRVIVPRHPGVLSAWGCVTSDVVEDSSRTVMVRAEGRSPATLEQAFGELTDAARRSLATAGFEPGDQRIDLSADLRYVGQSFELNVPWEGDIAPTVRAFHEAHRRRYGHADERSAAEIVTVRVRATGITIPVALEPIEEGSGTAPTPTAGPCGLRVYDRTALRAGHWIEGAALIVEDYSTTLVPTGWGLEVDPWGNLIVTRTAS